MKIHALTVVLESDVHDDDMKPLIDAIMHIRGVLSVSPQVVDSSLWTATNRVKNEVRQKLYQIAEEL